jgi:hypothetical protein
VTSSTELAQILQLGVVPDDELRVVLGSYFSGGRHSDKHVIDYMRGEDTALRLTYDKTGVVHAHAGSAWTSGDVADLRTRIEESLLRSAGSKVGCHVCFSAVPVEGAWRYGDAWQIRPMPSDAPRSLQLIGDHPFLLEVAYEASSDSIVSNLRNRALAREAALVLTGLTGRAWLASGSVGFAWALDPMTEDGQLTSTFRQLGYAAPGLPGSLDAFSDGHPPIEFIDDATFFGRRGMSTDQVLDFPQSMPVLLGAYYVLPGELRDRWLRWCYWLHHSAKVHSMSQSAAYIAVIQAIEALCPGDNRREEFRTFLSRYAPDPSASRAEREALYNLRSGLSHGGKLLRHDAEDMFSFFYPASINEMITLAQAQQLARVGGINWLASHGTSD